MATWRFVNFDRTEAQLLADFTGIANDLEATSEICDLLAEQLKKMPSNFRLLDALNCAALVRYARSFKTGVRKGLPETVVSELSDELRKDHEWFIGLRDKYVAHSVNTFEENVVHAYLVPEEGGTKEICSISVQENRLASLGIDDVNRLKDLAKEILSKVSILLETERKKVLEFAQSLPPETFYEQVDPPMKVAGRDDVNKSRRKQ